MKLHMAPQAVLGQRLMSMQVSPAIGVYPPSQYVITTDPLTTMAKRANAM